MSFILGNRSDSINVELEMKKIIKRGDDIDQKGVIYPSKSIFNDNLIYSKNLTFYVIKRLMDILFSFTGIILLFPVFIFIAICIKLNDGGPVLHFRKVIGFRGHCFYALKFRTMVVNADSYLHSYPKLLKEFEQNMKLENDPRITSFGRLLRKMSLDELPQLVNVLLGQMSLVGPRMIHPSEILRYGIYREKRLLVKPGITGLWQISSRKHTSYEERIEFDMRYIDTRSILLDIIIIMKTLRVFVIHTGI